jgi:sec-independent protein translocase protein TatB
MFEVGFTEIILILGIALVVLGPEKLPGLASRIGRWLGRARAMTRQLKMQLDDEVLHADQPWMRQRRTWQPPPATPPQGADRDAPGGEGRGADAAPDDPDAKAGP